ncbi:Uma2 family endonuclease [Pseudanabaena sp. FACHB-2040]|uniref:Uma2 family endonuclease n=1 Tax=Pseudanabaena sp. FACHB-2040 TaxID=2692859 RepID=UPI00168448C7|nr:Uma2 family endonuclease [Pseudanabaena sp. FACHB-2040]MBD2258675.1 Uma2 family endonuclease [Pseudanabaena sp. FACHB-2040]
MTATLIQSPDRVLLQNISWRTYQSLVRDFENQPAMRLTYDRGLLEIRMPLDPHETYKKLLGRLVEALTEELGLEIRSLGSRTCDREDLERGLEPDQCYYIQNEPAVWDKAQIDLSQDPPPDLAIEVDITSSSIDRLAIYTALGVPEVWRYNGQSLTIYRLKHQQYQPCDFSLAFPLLARADVEKFLTLRTSTKENALIRLFRDWVRTDYRGEERSKDRKQDPLP